MLLAEINRLWFALPLLVIVSLVYAATRHEEMKTIVTHAARFGGWTVVFMGAIAAAIEAFAFFQ
ncbi:MAG: hypothetical protein ACRCT8_00230 [Lacipirellulaceae bacterium]